MTSGPARLAATVAVTCTCLAGTMAGARSNTQEADLNSTLSQHAARTTTVTEEFVYKLKHPDGMIILYNGHRGSRIEPCGCRALNLGGIDKEAAMIQAIRRENPNSLFLDSGGFFREFTDPPMRLQTWYMLDALSHLGCQAMNIGFPDLRQGVGALKELEQQFKLPFTSANIINASSGESVFAPFKSFEVPTADGVQVKVAVVGVTAPNRDTSRGGVRSNEDQTTASEDESAMAPQSGRWMIAETNGRIPWLPMNVHHNNDGGAAALPAAGGYDPAMLFAIKGADAFTTGSVAPYRVDDPLEVARNMGDRLKPDNDYLVLLAFVSYDTAIKMAPDLPQYDLIIAADYVDHTEPARPVANGPLVIGGEYDGKYLGIVEVPMADGKPATEEADRLPILQTVKPLPEYTRYITDFTRQTEALPVEQPVASAEKIYAGATSCRTCHVDAYNQWKSHKHSVAMKSLVDKNMHFNPDCLRCHTVAYRKPGGFTDLRVSAHLANVQCEVCHGPGEQHVKDMRAAEALKREGKPVLPAKPDVMRMTWDQNFCMQCHDPQNDPRFNFVEDIQRVRHKNPEAQRVRPTTVSLEM